MSTVFDSAIQKGQSWVRELAEELGDDEQRAYQALRGTLHALRDRLAPEEAVHLGAQLPMLVRGLYYEGWTLSGKPVKRNREEFLDAVRQAFGPTAGADPEQAARAVFRLLEKHVTQGELQDVQGSLPKDLRELWR